MSWNDPCSDCGNPRHDCSCVMGIIISSKEQIEIKQAQDEENIRTCDLEGHRWKYVFIVSVCEICGEFTEY